MLYPAGSEQITSIGRAMKNIQSTPSQIFWTRLDESQLLLVRGPDAAKFLQGQVTCDVRELTNGVTRIGAQCNPKGRILLSFRAAQVDPETIALRIPRSMCEKAQQTLGKYIVFSKAEIVDAKDDFHLYGLAGENAEKIAANISPRLPENPDDIVQEGSGFVIQLATNRYEFWIPSTDSTAFAERLSGSTAKANEAEWVLEDIRQGIATIYPETFEIFTPQEINYQLVNAINFRKGCYTGQEIVARLHYRGKLKRHMYRFSVETSELPLPGMAIINDVTQQAAGHAVMARWINAQKAEILASVVDEHLSELALTGEGQKLKLLPLPYAIPTADEKNE